MILQALYKLYEELAKQNQVPRNGWYMAKVSHRLILDREGNLVEVSDCRTQVTRKNKTFDIPVEMQCPYGGVRTSGVKAYFLADTPKYLLGLDKDPNNTRSLECFEASKQLHIALLSHCDSPIARAICLYYEKWDPAKAKEHPKIEPKLDGLWKANTLIFSLSDPYAALEDDIEDPDIQKIWDDYALSQKEEHHWGPCLVTGKSHQELTLVHPTIKGINKDKGPLVSYNKESFCSQGFSSGEKGLNACISQEATMGYSAALNYLLSDKVHKKNLGGTTLVYWSEHGIKAYQDILGDSIFNDGLEEGNNIGVILDQLAEGKSVTVDNSIIDPREVFYILGLDTNSGRVIVRYFYRNSFGTIVKNIAKYQSNLRIIGAPANRPIPMWRTIAATKSAKQPDANASSVLLSSLMTAVFNGTPYPEAIYRNILMRIFATQDDSSKGIRKVDYVKASFIKAYLLRNHSERWNKKGGLQMTVNEECNEKSYVLGRIFSVLEEIQEAANPGVNATIKDRYFNGACTNPAKVFPILLKLSSVHMQKLGKTKKGWAVNLQKKMENLMAKIAMPTVGTPFPARLTLEEQGAFVLGYYQENKDRYIAKDKAEEEEDNE